MSLADELLEEARVSIDGEDPNQAKLRRSISTSYYAVFHSLVDAASHMIISNPEDLELRAAVRRTFVHARMADACRAFLRDRHKLSGLLTAPTAPELRELCQAFLYLQETRHRADYDTSVQFSKDDAIRAVIKALDCFVFWARLSRTEDARVFLVALLLLKDLRD